ncbi:F-actin-capping protein subunit alpha [Phakopsora pachyrhizi]|uniref:F-actin-capping protein subunit alpha n=1 Tax=Phakopsora pachyrhizi TaxID=170000 RepID=A0AAV0BP15_PHAPC|nr:F-actin-capping protein subunit alpha [Phakopsora pachyrhizi]
MDSFIEPTLEDKLAVASSLILQAPPGEINDVFNDLRPVVGDDNELETGLLPALSQYNTEQLTLVELPNSDLPSMICSAAKVLDSPIDNRYLDPNSSQLFTFDHLRLCATEVEKFDRLSDNIESFRLELGKKLEEYVQDHFSAGFSSVFSDRDQYQYQKLTKFQLYIVGSKYNPTNYWTGRWRSSYEVDLGSSQIKGNIQVNVHYYEQGNVQLSTNSNPTVDLTDKKEELKSTGDSRGINLIIKSINEIETKFQSDINLSYLKLGDDTFKYLRRTLPITKQKINWNQIHSRVVLNNDKN